jgi:8-oxo-dGTP diphosphatase
MSEDVGKLYGNRIRVRVCGLCLKDDALLMINHGGIGDGDFWAPPGGGIEFGQSIEETLIREFKEETGLIITPGEFKFGCEFINTPLHAIELFFTVHYKSGKITTGTDPEMTAENQIIKETKWISFTEIENIPFAHLHGVFGKCKTPREIVQLTGFWRI